MGESLVFLTGQFVASLAAVGILVLIAHAAGFSQAPPLSDTAQAAEIARLTPGGFEPVEIQLDSLGHGAICRDGAGAILLLVAHGARFVPVRMIGEARTRQRGDDLIIDLGRDQLKRVVLRLGEKSGYWAAMFVASNTARQ